MIKHVIFTLLIFFFSFSALATQLNIKISHKVINGKVFINGATNLPVGTKIGVGISSSDGYSAQSYDLLVQHNGVFRSDGFTNKGKPLIGSYKVEVISYINNFWQNKDTLVKLSEFTGNEIQDDEILVKYSMDIGTAKEIKKHIAGLPTKKQKLKVIQSIRDEGSNLYQQLLVMKSDPKFLKRGFSDPKSKEWDNKHRELDNRCINEIQKLPMQFRLQGELSKLCESINYLGQMGMRYAIHKSTDDNFTKTVKVQVESAFGINQ